ncbi:MAG: hypothetical protein KDI71_20165 [Xanthomonadales bacterium]|nr:hypothetical protein [Xanthomonadales bacterium]
MTMLRSIAAGLAHLFFAGISNAQNIGLILLYDDNDVLIGSLADPGDFIVWTPQRYKVTVEDNSGRVSRNQPPTDLGGAAYFGTRRYTTADCSGDAYLEVQAGVSPPPFGRVVVAISHTPYELIAIPSRPALTTVNVVAERDSATGPCFSDGGSVRTMNAVRLIDVPNDPEVTGVQNAPYTPPLKIESRPLSVWFELFKDGFESGAATHGLESFDRTV